MTDSTIKQAEVIKVWNSLNVRDRVTIGHINKQKSMTVPNQAVNLKALVKRYENGMPIMGNDNPIYEEEPSSGVNRKTLDLVDKQNLRESTQQVIDDYRTEMLTAERKAAKAKRDAEIKAAAEELLKMGETTKGDQTKNT